MAERILRPALLFLKELILVCLCSESNIPSIDFLHLRSNHASFISFHQQITCELELSHAMRSQEAPRTRTEMDMFSACKSAVFPDLRTSTMSPPARSKTYQKSHEQDTACLERG